MTTQTTISSQPLTVSTHEATVAFLNRLFPGPRLFAIRLWDGTVLAGTANPAFTLVLNTPGSLRRMLCPPLELALSEAFIRGDFEIQGDLIAVFQLFEALRSVSHSAPDLFTLTRLWLALPTAGQPQLAIPRQGIQQSAQRHSMNRDRAAIQYHYDIGNDFYALWLDQWMVYSCAYFPTGTEDIDQAQERKLEHICRKLRLKPGQRLLDIGCGWGGLVIYAA